LVIRHADTFIGLQWYVLVLTLNLLFRLEAYVIWEEQDQIWAKMFCIPKNMHSRTSMLKIFRVN